MYRVTGDMIRDATILALKKLLPFYEVDVIEKHAFDCLRNIWMRHRIILKYSGLGESPWKDLMIHLEMGEVSRSLLWMAEISTELTYIMKYNSYYYSGEQIQVAIEGAISKFIAQNSKEINVLANNSYPIKLNELRGVLPSFLNESDDLKLLNKLIEHFRWCPESAEYLRAEANFENLRGQN